MRLFTFFIMFFSSFSFADNTKYFVFGEKNNSSHYIYFENIQSEKFNFKYDLKLYIQKNEKPMIYFPTFDECDIQFNPINYCSISVKLNLQTETFVVTTKRHYVQNVLSKNNKNFNLPAILIEDFFYDLKIENKKIDKNNDYEQISIQNANYLLSELFLYKHSTVNIWTNYEL